MKIYRVLLCFICLAFVSSQGAAKVTVTVVGGAPAAGGACTDTLVDQFNDRNDQGACAAGASGNDACSSEINYDSGASSYTLDTLRVYLRKNKSNFGVTYDFLDRSDITCCEDL